MSEQPTYTVDDGNEVRLRHATPSDAADLAIFADAATRLPGSDPAGDWILMVKPLTSSG